MSDLAATITWNLQKDESYSPTIRMHASVLQATAGPVSLRKPRIIICPMATPIETLIRFTSLPTRDEFVLLPRYVMVQSSAAHLSVRVDVITSAGYLG